jgi:hypothetical protein
MQPAEALGSGQKVNVFISYARRDYAIAKTLYEQLIDINQDRVECFLDALTIGSGEGWENKLQQALLSADWLLCIFTGEQSEYCGYEVGVFARDKAIDKDHPESSRVVCFHDVENYPGIFRSHQNRHVQYPPEPLPTGEIFDKAKFYEEKDLLKFFRDFSTYKGLYVPRDAEAYERQKEKFIRNADNLTEAFRNSDRIRYDTPTQLGFEIIVPGKAGQAVDSIPLSAIAKGTYETFRLFGLMPPFQGEQLPSATWGSIKDTGKSSTGGYLPWVERLEGDMLCAVTGRALPEAEATFRGNDKTYRAVLVRHIVQFNGTHRFGIVFVPTLPRQFLGNQNTSMILAGLILASRFRFAYFEQPERVRASFSDDISDSDFLTHYRQLLYDLDRIAQEGMELGLTNQTVFVQSFGPNRQAVAEQFLTDYAKAKKKLEQSLPAKDAPVTAANRPQIKTAIMTFLQEMGDENSHFLTAALDAYQEELQKELRTKQPI